MNIIQNYKDIITKKYAAFDGRASKSEFWYFVLANMILAFAIYAISYAIGLPFLYGLYTFAVLVPGLAVQVRRLHDSGKSGWWWLLALTGFGALVLIVFYIADSDPGTNAYGPNPNQAAGGYAGAAQQNAYAAPAQKAQQNVYGAASQPAQRTASAAEFVVEEVKPVQPVKAEPVKAAEPVWVPEVDDYDDDDKTVAIIDDDMTMAIPDDDDDDDKTVALIDDEPAVAKLIRLSDNKVITCQGDAFSVGKSLKSANYVVAENEKISRRHATFYKKDGQYFVVDSSKNGTKINGTAAVQGQYTPVKDGDKIAFADEEFIFSAE